MNDIEFDDTIDTGALGRNGWFNVSGARIGRMPAAISIEPITGRGEIGRSSIAIHPANAAQVARALVELAAKMRPDLREGMAAELRAAVLSIEDGVEIDMDATVTTHHAPIRR